MASYFYNPCSSFSSTFPNLFDQFLQSPGDLKSGESTMSHSLILDNYKGELVEAPARLVKKGSSEEKTTAALKSHCEAERRRRERINSHLSALRGLVPCSEKVRIELNLQQDKRKAANNLDKENALLAEVVREVKEMKKKAEESCNGVLIPMDSDEIKVEEYANGGEEESLLSFKATLCCNYSPGILSELRQSLDTLRLKMVKAEVSTFGSRVKNVFVFTMVKEENIGHSEAWQCTAESIRRALNSVLDKDPFAPDYSPRTTLSTKRRRLSSYGTSSSSSGGIDLDSL